MLVAIGILVAALVSATLLLLKAAKSTGGAEQSAKDAIEQKDNLVDTHAAYAETHSAPADSDHSSNIQL